MNTPPWSHQCSPHMHLGTHAHTHTHTHTQSPLELQARSPKKESGAGSRTIRHSQCFCKTPLLPLGVLTTAGSKLSRKPQHVFTQSEPCSPRSWAGVWFRGERKMAGGLGGRRAHSIGVGPGDSPGGPKDPRQRPTRAPGVWMSGKDPHMPAQPPSN